MKTRIKIILFASSLLLLVGAHLLVPSVAYALPYGNETLGPDGQLTASQPSYIAEHKFAIPETDLIGNSEIALYHWNSDTSSFELPEYDVITNNDYYMIASIDKYNNSYYYLPALSETVSSDEFTKENGKGIASVEDLTTLDVTKAGWKLSESAFGYRISSYNNENLYLYLKNNVNGLSVGTVEEASAYWQIYNMNNGQVPLLYGDTNRSILSYNQAPYGFRCTYPDVLSSPEDMVIDKENKNIIIADTGNSRIVQISQEDEAAFKELTFYVNADNQEIYFKNPTGLAMNSQYLFVADKPLERIVVLDRDDWRFIREIKRPDSILVGSTTKFYPKKVQADDSGNIYIVLEESTKGVMQLDNDGNFVAYIGANQATTSLLTRIQSFLGIQNEGQMLKSGKGVTNICLDNKGLLYTITNNDGQPVKKLNTTGNTILTMNYNDPTTVSAFVDDDGNIFSIQSNGYVTVYDSYGSLLFRFGGSSKEEIIGALRRPVAAGLDENGQLLVLDQEAGFVVDYSPTHFANLVYKAVSYYKDGLYLEGEASWTELLKYNSRFILAYKALARASMKKGDYETALKQFKLAEDKAGYSDAFWQIRDRWIRKNLGWVLLPILILVVMYAVYKILDKRVPKATAPIKGVVNKGINAPVVRDMKLTFTFMRNPRETIYEIKYKKRASIIGASILYVLFAAIQILKIYLTGYLFNNVGRNDGLRTILMSTLPLLLLVVCNYYVSSVRDGEGKLKDIFIGFIYALSPYIVFSIPLFLISNIVTYNEQALYFMAVGIVYVWCGINIVLTVMELHDYSLWKAIINILLTLVCFILIIAFAIILYILGYQLFSYLVGVFKEVRNLL